MSNRRSGLFIEGILASALRASNRRSGAAYARVATPCDFERGLSGGNRRRKPKEAAATVVRSRVAGSGAATGAT
jgi:hypothetical protein